MHARDAYIKLAYACARVYYRHMNALHCMHAHDHLLAYDYAVLLLWQQWSKTCHVAQWREERGIVPVRGCPDWLISAQARVGTGGGRISRILGVPRVSRGPRAHGPRARGPRPGPMGPGPVGPGPVGPGPVGPGPVGPGLGPGPRILEVIFLKK